MFGCAKAFGFCVIPFIVFGNPLILGRLVIAFPFVSSSSTVPHQHIHMNKETLLRFLTFSFPQSCKFCGKNSLGLVSFLPHHPFSQLLHLSPHHQWMKVINNLIWPKLLSNFPFSFPQSVTVMEHTLLKSIFLWLLPGTDFPSSELLYLMFLSGSSFCVSTLYTRGTRQSELYQSSSSMVFFPALIHRHCDGSQVVYPVQNQD